MITQHISYVAPVLWLLLTTSTGVASQQSLGSHSPPSKGATVLGGKFPPPLVFYHHFVKLGQPLLMKNVLTETKYPAYQKWTDQYLGTKYGDEIVDIERGKKEDREAKGIQLRLSKFLEIYDKSNLYMVHTVPDSMRDEITVPHSLQCGGFQNSLQEAVVWLSSGDTRSVLHYDTVDNINCLLDGEKKLVLIDRSYKRMVEKDGWVENGAYSLVDVDAVDALKFPGIQHAAWYQINMKKGDCVFIPYKWYHHVNSPPGRNLAVNLWFSHLWWFNTTDCNGFTGKDSKPLTEFTMASPNEQLRSEFLARFEGNGDMSLKAFRMDSGCEKEEDAEKLFEMVNTNKDRKLTIVELYSFDMDEVVQKVPGCFNSQGTDDEDDSDDGNDAEEDNEVGETVKDTLQGDSVESAEPADNKGDSVGAEILESKLEEVSESLGRTGEEIVSEELTHEKDLKDSFIDNTINEEIEGLRLDDSGESVSSSFDEKVEDTGNNGDRKIENTKDSKQQHQKHSAHDEF